MTRMGDQWKTRELQLVEDLDSLKPTQPLDLVEDLDSLRPDLEARTQIPKQPLEKNKDCPGKFADLTVNSALDARGQTPPSELRTPTVGWTSTLASLFVCCERTTRVPYGWF